MGEWQSTSDGESSSAFLAEQRDRRPRPARKHFKLPVVGFLHAGGERTRAVASFQEL